MLYQAALVSDDTPIDHYLKGDDDALTETAKKGLDLFIGEGKCVSCHGGANFTNASTRYVKNEMINRMVMGDKNPAIYDEGFYNIGVRPTEEDLGLGGMDPFGNPLSFSRQAVQGINVDNLPFERADKFEVNPGHPAQLGERVAVNGSFKTPGLRNVELTGPYFHNGGQATLEQVVEFYARGGDFSDHNKHDLDADIQRLSEIVGDEEKIDQLVAFMFAMTDERVRQKKGIFDHPELFVFYGHPGDSSATERSINAPDLAKDSILVLPAVGKDGSADPIKPFLKGIIPGNVADDDLEIVNGYSGIRAISEIIGLDYNLPPVLAAVMPQEATVGMPVHLQMHATDPDGDMLVFSATVLPAGLSIDPMSGLITGIPNASGIFNTMVEVDDGRGYIVSESFVWTIHPAPTNGVVYFNGFEQGQLPWGADGQSQIVNDHGEANSGQYFLRMPADPGMEIIRYLNIPHSQWQTGHEYSLEFFARLSPDADGWSGAGFTFYDEHYHELASANVQISSNDWSMYSVGPVIAPANATHLEFWALSEADNGHVDFDDFQILSPGHSFILDGDLSDWNGVMPLVEDPADTGQSIDIRKLYGVLEQGMFHLAIENDGPITDLNWGYGWYIDTDNDHSTGYAHRYVGADYLLEGNILYQFAGGSPDSFHWDMVAELPYAVDGDSAEIILDSALIGGGSTFRFSFRGSNAAAGGYKVDSVPNAGSLIMNKNPNMDTGIMIDGDFSDWPQNGFELVDGDDVPGTNKIDVLSLKLHADNDNLYVGYVNETPLGDLSWSYSLFLDTDNNSSTGFPVGSIGADYLIQNSGVYQYYGTNGSWQWVQPSSAIIAVVGNNIEYSVALSDIGNPTMLPFLVLGDNSALGSSDGVDSLGGTFDVTAPQASQMTLISSSSSDAAKVAQQVKLAVSGQYSENSAMWLTGYGHNSLEVGIWERDSDRDGHDNLAEYAAGSDPNNAQSVPEKQIEVLKRSSDGDSITLRMNKNADANVGYRLEVSNDMKQWHSVDSAALTSVDESTSEMVWDLKQDAQSQFFRIRIELKSDNNQNF